MLQCKDKSVIVVLCNRRETHFYLKPFWASGHDSRELVMSSLIMLSSVLIFRSLPENDKILFSVGSSNCSLSFLITVYLSFDSQEDVQRLILAINKQEILRL